MFAIELNAALKASAAIHAAAEIGDEDDIRIQGELVHEGGGDELVISRDTLSDFVAAGFNIVKSHESGAVEISKVTGRRRRNANSPWYETTVDLVVFEVDGGTISYKFD